MSTSATDTTPASTIYFGYGSNLWQHQMLIRCPTSEYLGIARLNGYRWLINDRGYANVVETSSFSDVVWGLVYSLQSADEDNLDINEGVPEAYTKEYLDVDFWHQTDTGGTSGAAQKKKMLVYIDRKRIEPALPKKEYIYRMNMGIKDAVREGVPGKYVEEVMRTFIPDVEDETVATFARQQALYFEDER